MQKQVEEKREQIAELCRQYRVRRLALFGSALREDFNAQRSDLDFLVEFKPPGDDSNAYFGMIDALERLFAPRIDLVEAGSVQNPYIRKAIESQQETLYAA